MKSLILRIVLSLGLIVVLVSCQKKPEAELIGKWRAGDGTFEFFKDGRVVVTSPNGEANTERYTFISPDRVAFSPLEGGSGESFSLNIKITGDAMTVSVMVPYGTAAEVTYQRVKSR